MAGKQIRIWADRVSLRGTSLPSSESLSSSVQGFGPTTSSHVSKGHKASVAWKGSAYLIRRGTAPKCSTKRRRFWQQTVGNIFASGLSPKAGLKCRCSSVRLLGSRRKAADVSLSLRPGLKEESFKRRSECSCCSITKPAAAFGVSRPSSREAKCCRSGASCTRLRTILKCCR